MRYYRISLIDLEITAATALSFAFDIEFSMPIDFWNKQINTVYGISCRKQTERKRERERQRPETFAIRLQRQPRGMSPRGQYIHVMLATKNVKTYTTFARS